ncbi:MAG: phosphoglycolate phosphatase-like HAD superfamily hydrolase [Planctomycetota bacterium]|jgi:phosphoglycolate phosphatase-like HAD superfamily hydrolase
MKESTPMKFPDQIPPGLDAITEKLGIAVGPSDGQGRLLWVSDPAWVRDALGVLGIDCVLGKPQEGSTGSLTIPWPSEAEAASQIAQALSTALAPEAILLDLDGVLLDVGGGYPNALGGLSNIATLAQRLPLGVVTGLGRGQAKRLLASSGIAPLLTEVISADDATPKPSPDPVRLCLQRLGVANAWMLGDNLTDMTAARLAGVIPLGVRPAGWSRWTEDRRLKHSSALRAEGAARVIDGIADVLPLLMAQRAS